MITFRNVAIVAATVASLTAASATQSVFAQTNKYTRIQAGTGNLGPNGFGDRGFGGPILGRGYPAFNDQGNAPYPVYGAVGPSNPYFGQ